MFTGLIEDVGEIARIERRSQGAVCVIRTSIDTSEIALGDSIACDGVCLTATALSHGQFSAEASHETLARSTLGQGKPGQKVNLERALQVGSRLGGHFVAGHVDGVATLKDSKRVGDAVDLTYDLEDPSLARYIIEKGSVAVDGISLTVNRKLERGFVLTIIPHTAGKTTLLDKSRGQHVNIEVDMIGKYVESLLGLEKAGDGVNMELLERYGFTASRR